MSFGLHFINLFAIIKFISIIVSKNAWKWFFLPLPPAVSVLRYGHYRSDSAKLPPFSVGALRN